MKTWMRKHPVDVAIACWVIGMTLSKIPVPKDGPSYYSYMAALQYAIAALMLAVMVIMGGGDSLKRVSQGAEEILRRSIYPLAIAAVSISLTIFSAFYNGEANTENIVRGGIKLVILCISIGLIEETMMRGVLFSGLQKKLGVNRKGLAAAVVLSSLIFRFEHVANAFSGGVDLLIVVQAAGKLLTAAVLGMLYAVLYMRHKNIWMISLVHALNDFISMQPMIFRGVVLEGSYVSATTGEGIAQAVVYFAILLLYIPVIRYCVRMLKAQAVPEYGIFKD